MKTLYISIPITGHPIEEVKARANKLKEKLSVEGWEVVTPFDVVPDEEIAHIPNTEEKYAYCMGKDIEKILLCDAVFMAEGYINSKGCKLELQAARIYRRTIFFESWGYNICTDEQIKNSK